ncbi:MAG: tRNA pseudouridine(55) synthase TruB [Gammaproteobacteria bacterium]|nr:tRNA pseudouridine(55) synthase TruB [Gammaproteobacteria bacterium]MDP2139857.1 tRNA pseudouridine(55) synthase TruB [Gammaproteobacteria bacterium]MDP2347106.1 tRNA pseudouridine(55) synthase TruB [Gammaproteobacteria bacterium]
MTQWRRPKGRDITGILVLDKAKGMSSNACLQEVKRLFEAEKAGHTGSLDPLATGVLPLCFGEATKISQFLLDSDKRYRTMIRLGQRTDSADSQGSIISERPVLGITREHVLDALEQFRGGIEQTPPMYSALKHKGTPLYKLARAGEEVERKARPVTIHDLELLAFSNTDGLATLELEIYCSKGTYVRTIADDLGEALGCGGHVIELRRLQAGAFKEVQCVTIARLREAREAGGLAQLDEFLFAPDLAVAELPPVILPSMTADFLKQGQAVLVRHLPGSGLVRLYDEDEFIGIGTILDDGRVAPRRLFATGADKFVTQLQ